MRFQQQLISILNLSFLALDEVMGCFKNVFDPMFIERHVVNIVHYLIQNS